jgi:hypothetical protein
MSHKLAKKPSLFLARVANTTKYRRNLNPSCGSCMSIQIQQANINNKNTFNPTDSNIGEHPKKTILRIDHKI